MDSISHARGDEEDFMNYLVTTQCGTEYNLLSNFCGFDLFQHFRGKFLYHHLSLNELQFPITVQGLTVQQ